MIPAFAAEPLVGVVKFFVEKLGAVVGVRQAARRPLLRPSKASSGTAS